MVYTKGLSEAVGSSFTLLSKAHPEQTAGPVKPRPASPKTGWFPSSTQGHTLNTGRVPSLGGSGAASGAKGSPCAQLCVNKTLLGLQFLPFPSLRPQGKKLRFLKAEV